METPTHKVCTTCDLKKPLVEFSLDKHGKAGRAASCKACKREYAARYKKDNPEKVRQSRRQSYARNLAKHQRYRETNKEQRRVKRIQYYHKNREILVQKSKIRNKARRVQINTRRKIHRAENLEKAIFIEQARSHNYYLLNKEKIKSVVLRYRKLNPEKVRNWKHTRRATQHATSGNDLTPAQWIEIQKVQKHRCYYCGKRCQSTLTQDHILPISKGGAHTLHNIIGACLSCNASKKAGHPPIPVQPFLLTVAPAKKTRIAD